MKTVLLEATDASQPERRGIGMQLRAWYESAPYEQLSDIEFILARQAIANADDVHIEAANVRQVVVESSTEEEYVDKLYEINPDVIFFKQASQRYYRPGTVKQVGIDYGMEDFYCRNYIAPQSMSELVDSHRESFEMYTSIITVSKTSQRDLAWFFPEYKDKIEVLYPTLAKNISLESVPLPGDLVEDQFYVVVGYEHKKNIQRITSAFDDFKQQIDSPAKLVFVGKPGYGASEIDDHIAGLSCADDIVRLGYVLDSLKQVLLQKCHAVVVLPIYEGFGLSALEGLAAGRVVLASNNGSVSEVVGSAGFLADPFSIEDMTSQFTYIDGLKSNPNAAYIPERLAMFDTTMQAEKLLRHLARVANA